MKKLLKLATVMLFAVAVVCTTGCKKSSDNNDNNSGTVTPTYPTGAINGLFSVSADKQVYFSQGNLQYQASTNTWRFAENQWDYVGGKVRGNVYENGVKCDNELISESYNGWIDLFGWGTSGWNSGFNCYQPYSISNNNDDYYFGAGGNINPNIDWGLYNAISNGGNKTGLWRTMTKEEWEYVINERITNSGIRFALAKVNNVKGVILLPDNWSADIYSLNNPNEFVLYTNNIITNEIWENSFENNGAVFLTQAGDRLRLNYYDEEGCYWSLSQKSDYSSTFRWCMTFWENESLGNTTIILSVLSPSYGHSVRLVQDYQ